MSLLGSTIKPATVNKFSVTALQRILTALFVTVDMFDLVIPYFFDIWFAVDNYYCIGHQLAKMMPFVTIRFYKRYDLR